MSTPRSWSGGSGRQVDEVGWSWKVTEMGWGTDRDKKGKKGGCTMTSPPSYATIPSECFQDLCVWSRALGNKSGKLRYVLQIVTHSHLLRLCRSCLAVPQTCLASSWTSGGSDQ